MIAPVYAHSSAAEVWRKMKPESFEPGAPQTVRFARVRPRIEQRPFAPFQNVTTRGAGAKNRGVCNKREQGNGAASWGQ